MSGIFINLKRLHENLKARATVLFVGDPKTVAAERAMDDLAFEIDSIRDLAADYGVPAEPLILKHLREISGNA